ncbi:MAG: phosphatidate cytidylyltransferase [Mucinivorans sp.]
MNVKNLATRTLSGLILVWVIIECVASENYWYYIIWGAVGALSLYELFRLSAAHIARGHGKDGKQKQRWTNLVGFIYIWQAIAILMTMQSQWIYVIVLLTLVWSNDIGAYLIGSAVGRHPMAPSISPKKSWEGFAGGLLFSVGVALVWWELYFQNQVTPIDDTMATRTLWAGLGIVAGLGAVGGDLVESKFKRWIGVKDSGKIIPGHGGMLDRFDALFMATPIVWLYLKFIVPL